MDGWAGSWVDGYMDRWMDRWVDGSKKGERGVQKVSGAAWLLPCSSL
jgi:hypothetical protein